jgi:predicted nuclease with TOPRIM domain
VRRHRIETVAEGVGANTERIERLSSDIKEEFAEVGSMIKFSHAELDHRLRSLEQNQRALEESHRALEGTVAELHARLERIESSTH